MPSLSLIWFAVACLIAAQGAEISHRSKKAEKGQFKYQAYINLVNQAEFPLCGGAILSEWYILTSASCVQEYLSNPEKIEVHYGTTYVYWEKQKRKIAEIKLKSGYVKDGDEHDIALIRTIKEIDMWMLVQPAILPENEPIEGTPVALSGFGKTFVPDHVGDTYYSPFKLFYYETTTLSKSECADVIGKSKNVTDFICTQNVEGNRFFTSYSGNPLVADNTLYGLSLSNKPNVFTNVFAHEKWIQENIVKPACNFRCQLLD